MFSLKELNSAIIIGPAYPYRGGIANLNEALCDHLNQNGVKTEIVSFTMQYPALFFPGKSQMETSELEFGFSIKRMINSVNPISWIKTSEYIKKKKPDLVLVRYWLPLMAPCLGFISRRIRKAGIPVIAITDNIIPHEKRPGDTVLTRYFIQSCDAFLVMSEKVKTDIKQFNQHKPVCYSPHPIYSIFGNPVDRHTACEFLHLDPSHHYILFFGFIRKYKGLDLLIKALSLTKTPKVKLIVAGEFYEDSSEYIQMIEQLNLTNDVILVNEYIPKEKVKYYFSVADMVVQPYRNATQSGVTQIAYSFNKPMIVTQVGGLPEMVTHNISGFVVTPNSESIAQAVDQFYGENLSDTFVNGVLEEKKKFGWDKMILQIKTMFQNI